MLVLLLIYQLIKKLVLKLLVNTGNYDSASDGWFVKKKQVQKDNLNHLKYLPKQPFNWICLCDPLRLVSTIVILNSATVSTGTFEMFMVKRNDPD